MQSEAGKLLCSKTAIIIINNNNNYYYYFTLGNQDPEGGLKIRKIC